MFEDILGQDGKDFKRPKLPTDLSDPRPCFVLFTNPIEEKKKEEKELRDPQPSGAPRRLIIKKTKDPQPSEAPRRLIIKKSKFPLPTGVPCQLDVKKKKFLRPPVAPRRLDIKFPRSPGAPRRLDIKENKVTLQDVLDLICEPYRFEKANKIWRQQVSDKPANITDVQTLERELDNCLVKVRTTYTGFCPYRNRILLELFSEVIRIVSVDMKERGILLLRIKDYIASSIERLDKLYRSSMDYCIRKQRKLENRRLQLEESIFELRANTELMEDMARHFMEQSVTYMDLFKKDFDMEQFIKMKKLEALETLTTVMKWGFEKYFKKKTEKVQDQSHEESEEEESSMMDYNELRKDSSISKTSTMESVAHRLDKMAWLKKVLGTNVESVTQQGQLSDGQLDSLKTSEKTLSQSQELLPNVSSTTPCTEAQTSSSSSNDYSGDPHGIPTEKSSSRSQSSFAGDEGSSGGLTAEKPNDEK